MALATAYLTVTKNLGSILEAIRNAQAPEKFTTRFLQELGFKSTNDRLIIGVLKALGLLDDGGVPQQRYFEYLDETQSKRVLADGIRAGYADLFRVNNKANEMSQQEFKQKLKTLTQGSKGDAVLTKMASTFLALCKHADFSKAPTPAKPKPPPAPPTPPRPPATPDVERPISLAYRIHIELPSTRDQAVYEALFRALKEHLL